jgi:hypothetical protein
MNRELLKEWQSKLGPKLSHLKGVNGIELGKRGLIVRIEQNDNNLYQKILEIFDREAGEDVVFGTKVVGRHAKMSI